MKIAKIEKAKKSFNLECNDIAADKSISHRCAMFSLLSDKPSLIENFLLAEDTLSSLNIAKLLGAKVEQNGSTIKITPPKSLQEPFDILDCGNAGTGMRLYCGLLSGVDGSFVLTGDKYLRRRPMARVTKPLKEIGAKIDGREYGNKAPLHIRGAKLKAFKYESPIDSAQVKSALILAALNADNKSYYRENLLSRDHTERMLKSMGANIKTIRRIFFIEGWLISFSGAFIGIVLGGLICYAQQKFGLVKFPSDGMYIVDIYPTDMRISDFLLTFFSVTVLGSIVSWYHA